MSHLIVIAKYSFPLDANIAKASLESAGIPAFIADEHTINMQWLYSDAMGGVRLLIAEEHEKEASEILNGNFSTTVDTACESDIETCSNCQSINIKHHTKGKVPAFLVFLLAGFPLFFYKHGIKCLDCGHFKKT
ncbi:MAG: DUF2007 domain-containing protein [Colwellia sp.]